MNGGEMMVVLIVAIVMVARVIHVRGGGRDFRESGRRFFGNRDYRGRDDGAASYADDAENQKLREEVRALKDRIAVLERIATDRSTDLDREIEALRDRPQSRERL